MPTQITNTSVTTDDLTVDTNVLKVNSANNRVGIGTATPNNPLEIAHTGSAGAGGLRIGDPSTIASDTGIYLRTTGDAVIGAAGGNIVFDTNMAVQEDMRITSSGIVIKPRQPAFHIQGTGPAHTASQETAIYYVSTPTIKFNVGNHGVGGTDPATSGKFTCPASGMYLVCCTWYRGGSSGTDYMGTIVKKNGSSYYSYWYNNADNYGDASVGQTAMIQCSTNDVLQQYVYGNSSDADPGTTMQIYFLG